MGKEKAGRKSQFGWEQKAEQLELEIHILSLLWHQLLICLGNLILLVQFRHLHIMLISKIL